MRILLTALLLTGCAHVSRFPSSVPSGLIVNGDPELNPALALVSGAKTSLDIEIY